MPLELSWKNTRPAVTGRFDVTVAKPLLNGGGFPLKVCDWNTFVCPPQVERYLWWPPILIKKSDIQRSTIRLCNRDGAACGWRANSGSIRDSDYTCPKTATRHSIHKLGEVTTDWAEQITAETKIATIVLRIRVNIVLHFGHESAPTDCVSVSEEATAGKAGKRSTIKC
jgi:hypothetical protein